MPSIGTAPSQPCAMFSNEDYLQQVLENVLGLNPFHGTFLKDSTVLDTEIYIWTYKCQLAYKLSHIGFFIYEFLCFVMLLPLQQLHADEGC